MDRNLSNKRRYLEKILSAFLLATFYTMTTTAVSANPKEYIEKAEKIIKVQDSETRKSIALKVNSAKKFTLLERLNTFPKITAEEYKIFFDLPYNSAHEYIEIVEIHSFYFSEMLALSKAHNNRSHAFFRTLGFLIRFRYLTTNERFENHPLRLQPLAQDPLIAEALKVKNEKQVSEFVTKHNIYVDWAENYHNPKGQLMTKFYSLLLSLSHADIRNLPHWLKHFQSGDFRNSLKHLTAPQIRLITKALKTEWQHRESGKRVHVRYTVERFKRISQVVKFASSLKNSHNPFLKRFLMDSIGAKVNLTESIIRQLNARGDVETILFKSGFPATECELVEANSGI